MNNVYFIYGCLYFFIGFYNFCLFLFLIYNFLIISRICKYATSLRKNTHNYYLCIYYTVIICIFYTITGSLILNILLLSILKKKLHVYLSNNKLH